MEKRKLNRRDFTKLTTAALGGMVVGAGCSGEQPAGSGGVPSGDGGEALNAALLLEEPHVCRGLNMCQNKGASGENACAGQGTCATAEKHTCHEANACKGQGGCGESAGLNACKGKGECGVPMKGEKWQKVRAAFEAAYEKKEGKKPGAAPAA